MMGLGEEGDDDVAPIRRPERGFAALWIVVVASVSMLTWVVVDGVGRSVGTVSAAPGLTARPVVSSPGGAGVPVSPGPAGASDPGSSTEAAGASDPALPPVGDPATDGSLIPTPASGASTNGPAAPAPAAPPAGPAAPAAPAAPPAAPRVVTATFANPGGTVVVSCQGATLTVGGISPRDGFKVENETEGGHLSIKFKSTRSEYAMVLGCGASGPVVLTSEGAPTIESWPLLPSGASSLAA